MVASAVFQRPVRYIFKIKFYRADEVYVYNYCTCVLTFVEITQWKRVLIVSKN